MKRKLIVGVGVITLIFVVAGAFIFGKLRLVTSGEELRSGQEKVLDSYSDIVVHLRSAQAELYRHEAGFSRDIDGLVENVLGIEHALSAIKTSYAGLDNSASCNKCHAVGPKIEALRTRLDSASGQLKKYEELISLVATMKDTRMEGSWEHEATEEGKKLLSTVNGAADAAGMMTRHMEKMQLASLDQSAYSIFIAIFLSALLSLAVVFFLMRSVSEGLNGLISGIRKVSSGDYNARVDIVSDDEIGFLDRTFNEMTESLERTTRQRDLLEDELRQVNNSLEKRVFEATEELRRTHEQMLRTQTLSAVGNLASGVAHELATPLSSILNYVQMIRKRSEGDDGMAEEMDIIEKELIRCRDILRGMLSFVRAPEKEKRPTDINSVLREVIDLTRYEARSGKVSLKDSLAPSLPAVKAIPGQLKQVFLNIIMNGIQSMPDGGRLDIATATDEEGGKIYVRISDTGCGIPRADVSRIFEPFYTSKKEGTGLGLSVSYGIVKGHGGDIEVESGEGKGTTFIISLPVSDEPETKEEKADIHRRGTE